MISDVLERERERKRVLYVKGFEHPSFDNPRRGLVTILTMPLRALRDNVLT